MPTQTARSSQSYTYTFLQTGYAITVYADSETEAFDLLMNTMMFGALDALVDWTTDDWDAYTVQRIDVCGGWMPSEAMRATTTVLA